METINPLDHLADLAVFVRVVDTQGFSSAARAMGLTKSAISKRINRLEKQLGLRLLQRTTRAMSLTEAGRVLYERAAQGVALLDETARLAAGLVDAPRGTLRVTASVTFGKLCLAPLIPEFLARYPEIELQLTLLDRFVDLVDEGYDVALRLTRTPPDQVVAKALMPVRYRLCAAVDYLKSQKIEAPADLAGHNCLHYGLREFGNEWRFQRGTEEARVRVTSNVVDREIADGRLLPLLPGWSPIGPFGQTAYALWLPQTHLPPKIRVFVHFLAERLRERPVSKLSQII